MKNRMEAMRALRKHVTAGIALGGTIAATALPQFAAAVSSWSPTLLVNTESFQTIDDGDSTTDLELRFGSTLNEKILWNRARGMFQFTDDVSVQGTLSGSSLRIDGNADVHGTLSASGSVRTDGDLTINDDAGATDATLTFGNATANQTVKFLNGTQRFQFSRGLSVVGHLSGASLNVDRNATVGGSLTATGAIRTKGNLSGSTLTIDGAFNWRGIQYTAPTSQSANTFLKTDGNGVLTWSSNAAGNGSGNIMSLHPEYPHAVYFSSGSTFVGQLTASGGTSALDNSYVWTSTRSALQDYWISVRVRLPDNFSSWDPVKPIEVRYKTGVASNANNHVTVRMKDTAGANVALTNGGALSNVAWTTGTVTGPQSAGTWTPKGYFTVYIKVAANSTASANAAVGFINFNYETTTP